jgi:hypothetical protein
VIDVVGGRLMDVSLSDGEQRMLLAALWNMKVQSGALLAETDALSPEDLAKALSIVAGIDQIAFKFGGKSGPVYGLGQ